MAKPRAKLKPVFPGEWIDLLVARGHELREAGVTALKIGDVAITFAPYEAPQVAPTLGGDDANDREPVDPLLDPATYGRSGSVPGFPRPRDDDESDDFEDSDLEEYTS